MEEHERRQIVDKGSRAAALLEDELLKEAFEAVRQTLRQKWELADAYDAVGREETWKMLHCLRAVEVKLRQFVNDGKMERFKMDEVVKMRAREERAGSA